MTCKYHPSNKVVGQCSKCGADYCELCDFEVISGKEHTHLCLDCSRSFAVSKIVWSVICTIGGFIFGATVVKELSWSLACAYLFWSIYWGLAWSGWSSPSWQNLVDGTKYYGVWGLPLIVILLFVQLTVSAYIGCLGFGIVQTVRLVKTIKLIDLERNKAKDV
jgi:hypothetical protein